MIFLNFLWQNDWIFNNSHTISPNNMESPSCTPIHQRLSNNTSCAMGGTWFEWHQHDKQNKLPSLIDRFFYCPLFHFIFNFLLVMVFSFCSSMFFFSALFCHATKNLIMHKKNEPNWFYTWDFQNWFLTIWKI